MAFQEIPIDWFATAKAVLHPMPEADPRLAKFPAQAHVAVVKSGQKIDQADIQVLDLGSQSLHLSDRVL